MHEPSEVNMAGRAGFIDFFTKLGRKPMNPIPKAMPVDQLPVVSGAKGDFVWLTSRGRLLSNEVFERFILVDEVLR